MKDYEIIVSEDKYTLAKEVNEKLKEGFVLVGGVSITLQNGNDTYPEYAFAQAIAKQD